MRIYQPTVAEGFEWVLPVDEDDFKVFRDLGPGVRSADWSPVRVRLVTEDEGETFAESDFPWLGSHALIMRDGAIELLGDLLSGYGELLPLDCDDAELAVLNVHRIVDALDADQSSVIRFPTSGRVMTIEKHVFRPSMLGNAPLFKIPEVATTYVTEEFVRLVRSARLRGLRFELVWENVTATGVVSP